MVSYYPAFIDTSASLPPFVDGQPVQAAPVERLRETVIAIEAELGIRPSGAYTTVRARLDALETILDGIHVIQLNGDLGGTLDTPKVIGIQGRPVSDAEPTPGEVLVWNGIAWSPAPGPSAEVTFGGDLSGSPTTQTVVGIQNRPVDPTAPDSGQALVWNGSVWIPTLVAAGSSGLRAVASSQPIPSQASEPGWYVIGAFYLSNPLTNATVEAIGGVSDPSVTLTVRLFSLGTVSEVASSRAVITSIPDVREVSSVIASLPAGVVYQVQAQAISTFGPADAIFGVVKSVDITT